jgi:hypothetical protein
LKSRASHVFPKTVKRNGVHGKMRMNIKLVLRMAGAFLSTLVTVQVIGLVVGLGALGLIGFPLQEGLPAFRGATFAELFLLFGLIGTFLPSAVFSFIIVTFAVVFRHQRRRLLLLFASTLVVTVAVYVVALLSMHVWELFSIFSGILFLVSTVAALTGAAVAYVIVGSPKQPPAERKAES